MPDPDRMLQSQGQLTIDGQGIVWRKSGGGRKLELPKKGKRMRCPLLMHANRSMPQ